MPGGRISGMACGYGTKFWIYGGIANRVSNTTTSEFWMFDGIWTLLSNTVVNTYVIYIFEPPFFKKN